MAFPFWKKKEDRGVTQSETDMSLLKVFGLVGSDRIDAETALTIPAVWAAVNFISGTIAGLPLQVFTKTKDGRRPAPDKLNNLVGKSVNDGRSSFAWRYDMFSTGVLYSGRSVTYIERDQRGQPVNLFPVMGDVQVRILPDGRKVYAQKLEGGEKIFEERQVLDIIYMLKPDMVTARSPIKTCSEALNKAYQANKYGGRIFENGGLPSHALEAPVTTGAAASRASDDMSRAVKEAARNGSQVLVLPTGHVLKPLGVDPDKMQLVDSQRFGIEEVARIFQLPPVFLQDLTHGTFSNTEQQDLQLVKHTIKRWCEQLEAEMNLKLFGRNSKTYVEFNLDGLMRGDFMSTMQGNAVGIQSGQITPNETRTKRNLEPKDGGDKLFIQGATVPLETQGQEQDG